MSEPNGRLALPGPDFNDDTSPGTLPGKAEKNTTLRWIKPTLDGRSLAFDSFHARMVRQEKGPWKWGKYSSLGGENPPMTLDHGYDVRPQRSTEHRKQKHS
jgi:hypothetical protein